MGSFLFLALVISSGLVPRLATSSSHFSLKLAPPFPQHPAPPSTDPPFPILSMKFWKTIHFSCAVSSSNITSNMDDFLDVHGNDTLCVSVTALNPPELGDVEDLVGVEETEWFEETEYMSLKNEEMNRQRQANGDLVSGDNAGSVDSETNRSVWRTVRTCFNVKNIVVAPTGARSARSARSTGLCGLHHISVRMLGPDGETATMPEVDPVIAFVVGGHTENTKTSPSGFYPCRPRDPAWMRTTGGRRRGGGGEGRAGQQELDSSSMKQSWSEFGKWLPS